jgi:hypothetical protein
VSCGDLATEQADPAAAYDREPYLFRVPAPHAVSPDFSLGQRGCLLSPHRIGPVRAAQGASLPRLCTGRTILVHEPTVGIGTHHIDFGADGNIGGGRTPAHVQKLPGAKLMGHSSRKEPVQAGFCNPR